MKRNRFLCFVLCLCVLMLFAACTQDGAVQQQTAATQSTEGETANEASSDEHDAETETEPVDEEKAQARANALPERYDDRMEIWEHPAGYRTDRKADELNISERDWLEVTANTTDTMIGEDFHDITEIQDSFYNGYILGNGLEKETFEDIPYVIPYLVKDAFGAVIVIPGGGFYYKTMNGHTFEAGDVARSLNSAGYSAFVLNYRSNPYEYPIPQLDVQRAVRYVRSIADEYSFPADNIGLIGFSAGAFQAAYFLNVLMGNDCFPDDYTKDSLDAVDDTVQHAAFIYPMFDFRHNVSMLCNLFDRDTLLVEENREAILDETDMTIHFTSKNTPQFLAYGATDRIAGTETSLRYLRAARSSGGTIAELYVMDKGHLFEQEDYMDAYLGWLRTR